MENPGFFASMSKQNLIAFALIVFAKFLGFFGIILGFIKEYRLFAGLFLIIAFVAITVSIVISIIEMKKINKNKISLEKLLSCGINENQAKKLMEIL